MELSNKYTWEPPDDTPSTFLYDELTMPEAIEEEALMNDLVPGDEADTTAVMAHLVDLCVRKVHGWEGITENGEPLPCTPETRERIFNLARSMPIISELVGRICPTITVTSAEKKASPPGCVSASSDPGSSVDGGKTTAQVSDGVAV